MGAVGADLLVAGVRLERSLVHALLAWAGDRFFFRYSLIREPR